jgi:hypothetical protein
MAKNTADPSGMCTLPAAAKTRDINSYTHHPEMCIGWMKTTKNKINTENMYYRLNTRYIRWIKSQLWATYYSTVIFHVYG